MFLLSLLSLLLLTLTVNASPYPKLSTLQFAAKISNIGAKNLVQIDRQRVAHHRATANRSGKRNAVEDVTDPTAVQYIASVGIGSPPTQYNLLIDTGSSNTWVGSSKKYKQTSTSKKTGETIAVTYGSGHMTGDEYTDTVSVGKGLTIEKQSIGVATQWQGFRGIDGILGLGPVDLTTTTLSSQIQVPTVVDNLASQKKISQSVLGIFFAPGDSHAGSLSFGTPEQDKILGDITYVPITTTTPSAHYWGFEQSVQYNGKEILKNTAGTIDTGTTLTLLASDAYNAYKNATGAVLDSNTAFLSITSAQFSQLKNLDFEIGGKTFTLNANAQIWPRSLNGAINGEKDKIYLIVSDAGSDSGSGLDFVMGFTWLQRFYTVYDTGKKRIGFANTSYTSATTN
jgi:pepsin A